MPAPQDIRRLADQAIAELPEHRRELFGLQLDRRWPDLLAGLSAVYPANDAAALAQRLVVLAARAFADRDPELSRLDLERTLRPDWFQDPTVIGYAAYTDRFAGTLSDLVGKIPYLQQLGVTYLHLMPLLNPREGDSDGGYAVQDYRRVRPDLGTVDDLRKLAAALRAAGISLVLDLVLNHVAAEHEWAVKAAAGDERYRDYFYVFDDRTVPDAYERTLPEVFPDFAPGNFTFVKEMDAWVWTTFNTFQWDVKWTNPDVFYEYADIVLFLANAGVEVLRLDAIAFIYKRLGTNCQNQPEVHAITQALRAITRMACPAVCFKAEAIVGPTDLVHYLGQGQHHGKVSDIAYHNSLMVHIWSMLAAQDVRLAAQALSNLPTAPASTAWVSYLRCHDDIGWAIDDGDAAAVGLNGHLHRAFLSDYYAGLFPGSTARGLVFQHNPATGDRRISGMAASLLGREAAEAAGDNQAAVDTVVGRFFCAYAMVFGWGGIPVLWMGDELGLTNDEHWDDEPGHATDNRWTHRPRMDWAVAEQRTDDRTVIGQVGAIRHLIGVRQHLDQLHASVAACIGRVVDPGVLPVVRQHPYGALVELFNVSASWRPYPASILAEHGVLDGMDQISGETIRAADDGNIWLAPYAALWITAS